jgi:[NiFe] hydrogenase assembly HybE family chaperone
MNDDAARAIGAQLAEIYRRIWTVSMRDVPICNAALEVEAVGFRAYGRAAVGIVLTPWFMNLVIVDSVRESNLPAGIGAMTSVALPAGEVECVGAWLDGFGLLRACSLFSPMFDFAEMAVARTVAEEAMKALFARPSESESPDYPTGVGRRALLTGRLRHDEEILS